MSVCCVCVCVLMESVKERGEGWCCVGGGGAEGRKGGKAHGESNISKP